MKSVCALARALLVQRQTFQYVMELWYMQASRNLMSHQHIGQARIMVSHNHSSAFSKTLVHEHEHEHRVEEQGGPCTKVLPSL